MTIILAVDVSLARTGLAVLDDGQFIGHAVIETSAKWQRYQRLGELYGWIQAYIQKWGPDVIAIETSAGWQRDGHDSSVTRDALAQARAAVLIAAYNEYERARVRIVEMDPHDVRELVCGNRNASKEQVQAALVTRGFTLPTMRKRVRVDGKYEVQAVVDPDCADAICLAAGCWSEQRLLAMREGGIL